MNVFGDKAFKEGIMLKWEHKGGCSELLHKEGDKGDRGAGRGEQTGIH